MTRIQDLPHRNLLEDRCRPSHVIHVRVGEDHQFQELDATLCFVDISGFTNLSEKLARRGRIGAEELTAVLNLVFANMLEIAYLQGGSLLKFGGDALLLMFTGFDHATRAASAAVEMRAALRTATESPTTAGRVRLHPQLRPLPARGGGVAHAQRGAGGDSP